MKTNILKFIVVLVAAAGGFFLARGTSPEGPLGIIGLAGGISAAIIALLIESALASLEPRQILGGIIGLLTGLAAAHFMADSFGSGLVDLKIQTAIRFTLSIVLGYLGVAIGGRDGFGLSAGHKIETASPEPVLSTKDYKILDTSVIIDGRIADICETGFLEGTFVIPQFVLRELQHIADSSDGLKRNRGRRGLDILHKLQKKADLNVTIEDTDFPRIREVDSKLVALAKQTGGKIITNDFNLNKIAELQGVPVLNINQLANALKPVVLPGELMKVYILKEGKEQNQGVAYLDDGTMVVVDNAKKEIGKTIDVLVTSVLQTTAGRMIFTQIKEDARGQNS
jgi:uncharacterized protein YacL